MRMSVTVHFTRFTRGGCPIRLGCQNYSLLLIPHYHLIAVPSNFTCFYKRPRPGSIKKKKATHINWFQNKARGRRKWLHLTRVATRDIVHHATILKGKGMIQVYRLLAIKMLSTKPARHNLRNKQKHVSRIYDPWQPCYWQWVWVNLFFNNWLHMSRTPMRKYSGFL